MIISQKTIEKLRSLINEETEYRSGPKLVAFFNKYGFADLYEPGFPSRWIYTESKLKELNGKPELDKCIKDLFAPINFISRFSELDKLIGDFNQYLSFDGWQVVRQSQTITFQKAKSVDIDSEKSKEVQPNEIEFLKAEFKDISISSLPVDSCLIPRSTVERNQAMPVRQSPVICDISYWQHIRRCIVRYCQQISGDIQ